MSACTVDFIQHRRLVQMHDQFFTAAFDRHGFEQMRSDQRLQRRIPRGLVEVSVGGRVKVGAHGRDIDALVAFDGNRGAGLFLDIADLGFRSLVFLRRLFLRKRRARCHAHRQGECDGEGQAKAQRAPRSHATRHVRYHARSDIRTPLPGLIQFCRQGETMSAAGRVGALKLNVRHNFDASGVRPSRKCPHAGPNVF
jgi:hypothetical protein